MLYFIMGVQGPNPGLRYAILKDAVLQKVAPGAPEAEGILLMDQNVVLNYWNLATANKVGTSLVYHQRTVE